MTTKKFTCIECPKSCGLTVDIENGRVVKVTGNLCPRGEEYAKAEVENPQRIFTGVALCLNLPLKMLPVRTDKPIPKDRVLDAAAAVRQIRVNKPVNAGDIIAPNFLGLDVRLIATRST
jgi:CxxC motif-containing protein